MANIIKTFPSSLMCFSHLRWDFVYQRPQHLLSRFSNLFKIYFFEEPLLDASYREYLSFSKRGPNLYVIVPHLIAGLSELQINKILTGMVDKFLLNKDLDDFVFWYYSPMAVAFSDKHNPKAVIYDCMDELSAFKNAPRALSALEKKLMKNADVMFTGGNSLYEAKKNQHANVHPFPSSIEKDHFERARKIKQQPKDQLHIDGPKIGFYGVIDERFDIDLIKDIAERKPDWQIILLGPVVKIDQEILPVNKNIHYLGPKKYQELPAYLSGWDVALIPFLLNESTRFISPTKTPEYLSAGIPVVSTPIKDVVDPYGNKDLVHIGNNSEEFIRAIESELQRSSKENWLLKVDQFLSTDSWDSTYQNMLKLIINAVRNKSKISVAS